MSALIDWDRLPTETPKSYAAFLALGARRSVREAARQHHVKTMSSGPEVTTVKHWLRWSARHKWVSRTGKYPTDKSADCLRTTGSIAPTFAARWSICERYRTSAKRRMTYRESRRSAIHCGVPVRATVRPGRELPQGELFEAGRAPASAARSTAGRWPSPPDSEPDHPDNFPYAPPAPRPVAHAVTPRMRV